MIKWVCIVIAVLVNYSYARGAAKGNSMYGDGNVLANTYCQYVGLDCSSTCCIQQSCAASLNDCEYGITTDMLYLYYIAAGIVGLIFLIPILVKIFSLCSSIEFRKKCFKSSEKSKARKKETSQTDIRYHSNIMRNLERSHFSIDQSLDEHYLRPIEDLEEMKSMFDNPHNRSNIEAEHTELDEMNSNDGRHKKPVIDSHREIDQYGNMISNQPYKNNESTNKDELSEDSVDRESVEITQQKLRGEQLKTITPIEAMTNLKNDKSKEIFPTINEEMAVHSISREGREDHSEESKSNKALNGGTRNEFVKPDSHQKRRTDGQLVRPNQNHNKKEESKNGSETKALSHYEKGHDDANDFEEEL